MMLRTSRQPLLVVVAASFLLGACALDSADLVTADSRRLRGESSRRGDADSGGDAMGQGDADGGDRSGSGPHQEICDGYDNDGDGEIDEGLSGGDCTDSQGRHGTTVCSRGSEICQGCEPRETRTKSCECAPDVLETCGEDGFWLPGTCDGCSESNRPRCDTYDRCEAGTTEIRRCDTCNNGNCGSDCVGAEWRCNAQCEWIEISGCQVYEEQQCSEDDVRVTACGRCGTRLETCDGCFWHGDPCEEQGECEAGQTQVVPCGDGVCADGLYTSLACNSSCEWELLQSCGGCVIGETTTEEACVPGAECGSRITRTTCAAVEVPICGGTDTITMGEALATEVLRDDCPSNECHPGQTSSGQTCTTDLGECGSHSASCTNHCTWESTGDCIALPHACVPGTVEDTEVACNNTCGPPVTITQRRTCRANGCGWATTTLGSCPCTPGASVTLSCTMGDGRCGTTTRECSATTCDWVDSGICTPRPHSCVPGTVEETVHSCGPQACGETYTETRTCRSHGCGWGTSTTSCPACNAGDTTQESCITGQGECGTRTMTCSSSTCEWVSGPCEPSPHACVPGTTVEESCSAVCGLPGTQRFTCRSNGCGYTLTSSCTPLSPPPCEPGDSESELCPGCQTATKERYCTADCAWGSWTDCPPCG